MAGHLCWDNPLPHPRHLKKQQPARGFPAYAVFLCGLTAIYLAVEVPFASYLVELMGGNPSGDEVERVEHAGRIISGFAVALAFWSFQIPKYLKSGRSALRLVFSCALSAGILVPAVYFAERTLVDHIAEASSNRDRQQAARLVAAREALFHPDGVAGFGVGGEGHTWDAFRSLFGFMNMFDDDILSRIPSSSNVIESGIARTLPSEPEFRGEVLPNLLTAYRERYQAYRELSDGHSRGMNALYGKVEEGWRDHLAYLKRAGPARARQAVIRRIDVPPNWDVYDKRTFTRAAISPRLSRVDKSYQYGIDQLFGDNAIVSPGKETLSAFMESNQIQSLIAKDLTLRGRPDFNITESISHGNTIKLFQLYVSAVTRDLKAAYQGDNRIFGNGQQFEAAGKEAVRSVAAPVLALSLSILGALGHMFKLLNYLVMLALHLRQSRLGVTRLIRSNGLVRLPILGVLVTSVATTTYAPATEVTSTDLYQRSVAAWTARAGEPFGRGIEWTISVQQWISPTSSTLRTAGLFTPVEDYLEKGWVDLPIPLATAFSEPVSGALYGSLDVNGLESMIQLPRPRPDR